MTSGGPYATVATGVTATNYYDAGVSWATTYYYVVSTTGVGGESTNSAQASATTLPLPQPRIVNTTIASGSLVFSGTNGLPGGTYQVLSSTNLMTPQTDWTQVGSGSFDGNGNFNFTNAVSTNELKQFFLLRLP